MTQEHNLTVAIGLVEEGGCFAECSTLPECASQGGTYAEAVANIQDAIEGTLETLLAHGEPVPPAGKPIRR